MQAKVTNFRKQKLLIFEYKNYENIELIKGDIVSTVPKYIQDNPELKISLLHVSTDTITPLYRQPALFQPKIATRAPTWRHPTRVM